MVSLSSTLCMSWMIKSSPRLFAARRLSSHSCRGECRGSWDWDLDLGTDSRVWDFILEPGIEIRSEMLESGTCDQGVRTWYPTLGTWCRASCTETWDADAGYSTPSYDPVLVTSKLPQWLLKCSIILFAAVIIMSHAEVSWASPCNAEDAPRRRAG